MEIICVAVGNLTGSCPLLLAVFPLYRDSHAIRCVQSAKNYGNFDSTACYAVENKKGTQISFPSSYLAIRLYFFRYVLQAVLLFCIPGLLMTIVYAKVCLRICHGFQYKAKSAGDVSGINSINGCRKYRVFTVWRQWFYQSTKDIN